MREPGDVAVEVSDDPVGEAVTDHHLDEIAEMIERALVETRYEPTDSGDPAGSPHGS